MTKTRRGRRESEPYVGDAFAGALLRTIRDSLQGNYTANPETWAALFEALELTPEELHVAGSYYFSPARRTQFVR